MEIYRGPCVVSSYLCNPARCTEILEVWKFLWAIERIRHWLISNYVCVFHNCAFRNFLQIFIIFETDIVFQFGPLEDFRLCAVVSGSDEVGNKYAETTNAWFQFHTPHNFLPCRHFLHLWYIVWCPGALNIVSNVVSDRCSHYGTLLTDAFCSSGCYDKSFLLLTLPFFEVVYFVDRCLD